MCFAEDARAGSTPRGRPAVITLAAIVLALGMSTGAAYPQSPPNTPPITSPALNQVVSPFDVHMEAGPFSDPDPGDTHFCTDWEIWTLSPLERVWVTSCIQGVEKVHTHLGDGTFENSHAGRTGLFFSTNYKLRVRFKDNTGLWSNWAERPFSTGAQSQVFPLITNDVAGSPTWISDAGTPIALPASPTARLRLESGTGALLLQISGNNGVSNTTINPAALAGDVAVRAVLEGGSPGLSIPDSRVSFTDPIGIFHTVYLGGISLPPSGAAYDWVASDGSTYVGTSSQTTPDFSTLARGSPVPWTVFRPGYDVEVVATGFALPVNIAFVPNPGPNPGDPFYYVTELYGTVRVVSRNGSVSTYATNLLNFDPTGVFPGSGEQGLAGIAVDPVTGDVFVGMLYDAAPPDGPHYPKVVRLHSTDGGRTAATQTTILSMPGELQGQSHFISNFTIGPDGKLYVHLGDGFESQTALNLDSFRGKILRMNLDGTAPVNNPFYDAGNGINARDYVFAYGFRNPFGGAWRAADGLQYEVENGLSSNDRFARVLPGVSYGWNGDDATMTTHAIYNWNPTVAPVNIAFVQPSTFGGSRFPAPAQDHAFVTLSGATYAPGPSDHKAIVEFVVDNSGNLVSGPTPLIQYSGSGLATAVGLAAGPDGLYFTDLYKDQDASSPTDPGARVLRIKYRGIADFSASAVLGGPPLTTTFTDLSDVPGATGWFWSFGDGQTSTTHNPTHQYTGSGLYDVGLTVTGSNGSVSTVKEEFVVVTPYQVGLKGNYYVGTSLQNLALSRVDPAIDFDWGAGSPAPSVPVDDFSVRWTGDVLARYSETYSFVTTTDDGVRLWINNQLVIDHWQSQGLTELSADVPLLAGQWYPIKMEYYDDQWAAVARLSWQSPSLPKQVIPQSRLRVSDSVVAPVEPDPTLVSRATLLPSGPNPFQGRSELGFAIPRTGRATLLLYSVRGEVSTILFDGTAEGQRLYRIPFEPKNLPAGVYFERLEAPGTNVSRKLVILH